MSFISYAQNLEDVMLYRALKHIKEGFYIDVGAQDPIVDSVTKAFYDMGWKGINIEPSTYWYNKIVVKRSRDINLQLFAGEKNSSIELYEFTGSGHSTYVENYAKNAAKRGLEYISRIVPSDTLNNICEQYKVKDLHFLKIDVEGAEDLVLKGINFNRIRPWVCVIESTEPDSIKLNYSRWVKYIEFYMYELVYFDGLNRFYLAKEHMELKKHFMSPPNVFDNYIKADFLRERARADHQAILLDVLYNSWSWKITKPLRKIKLAVKSIKNKLNIRNVENWLIRYEFKGKRLLVKCIKYIFKKYHTGGMKKKSILNDSQNRVLNILKYQINRKVK